MAMRTESSIASGMFWPTAEELHKALPATAISTRAHWRRARQSASSSSLDGEGEAVLGKLGLDLDLAASVEHVGAHVGQD